MVAYCSKFRTAFGSCDFAKYEKGFFVIGGCVHEDLIEATSVRFEMMREFNISQECCTFVETRNKFMSVKVGSVVHGV